MSREFSGNSKLLDGATSTGAGQGFAVKDFEEITFEFHTTGSFNGTVDFLGSIEDSEPDWSSSASETNHYTKIQVTKFSDGTTANNVSSSGSDVTDLYYVKNSGLSYVNVDFSSRTAGTVHVHVKGFA